MENPAQKVTTTDDMLRVYQDRDLSSSVMAQVPKGREIQLGAATVYEGREWMAATLEDGVVGHVLGPSARSHTTLGGTRFAEIVSGDIATASAMQAVGGLGAKQRHGCLTAWLVMIIIVSSLCVPIYLFASGAITRYLPNTPGWALPVSAVMCIANVVCAVALFQWKKWGFFGFVGTTILGLFINLAILPTQYALSAMLGAPLGVAVLYWVLQIGKEKKGWTQLE